MKTNKLIIKIPPPRNPMIAELVKKKAGSHEKPYKSLRKLNKINPGKIDIDKF